MANGEIGYIYVLVTPAFADEVLKIGYTTRFPTERIMELSAHTGVPVEFVIAYTELVHHPNRVEQEVHKALAKYRMSEQREFFRVPLSDAIGTIRRIVTEICPPLRVTKEPDPPQFICKRCG